MVAVQDVKIVKLDGLKTCPATRNAVNAPVDGEIPAMDRPAATQYHRGRTHGKVFKPYANVGTLVPVQTHHERHVQKVRIPTTRAPSPAFLVHRVHFPAKKKVLNAMNVPRVIYNPSLNNQNVFKSKLDPS